MRRNVVVVVSAADCFGVIPVGDSTAPTELWILPSRKMQESITTPTVGLSILRFCVLRFCIGEISVDLYKVIEDIRDKKSALLMMAELYGKIIFIAFTLADKRK